MSILMSNSLPLNGRFRVNLLESAITGKQGYTKPNQTSNPKWKTHTLHSEQSDFLTSSGKTPAEWTSHSACGRDDTPSDLDRKRREEALLLTWSTGAMEPTRSSQKCKPCTQHVKCVKAAFSRAVKVSLPFTDHTSSLSPLSRTESLEVLPRTWLVQSLLMLGEWQRAWTSQIKAERWGRQVTTSHTELAHTRAHTDSNCDETQSDLHHWFVVCPMPTYFKWNETSSLSLDVGSLAGKTSYGIA